MPPLGSSVCLNTAAIVNRYISVRKLMRSQTRDEGLMVRLLDSSGLLTGRLQVQIPASQTVASKFVLQLHPLARYAVMILLRGARWSSGINAANGACRPRFASRILPIVQRPWTSR